jgi:hypothetical protein
MAQRMIQIDGRWRINPAYLKELPTIKEYEPWELKYIDTYKGVEYRYWLGGYFDGEEWIEPAVTVDMKKEKQWIQIDQYN